MICVAPYSGGRDAIVCSSATSSSKATAQRFCQFCFVQLGVITGILLFSHSTSYQRPFAGLGDSAHRCAPACLRTHGAMGISL